MKYAVLIALLALAFSFEKSFAWGNHFVNGYERSNGTYVQPHWQSNPDSSRFNNYSTQGNMNPYTGQAGNVPAYPQFQNSVQFQRTNYQRPYGY